ncbi:ABC transporter permease [Segnochrobactrum spirostomi]|uniref:ABC transporter permease n=1 Tax=Segnochrobactrum spirostomi TaxID=2608987 RepID=A0A6A7XZP7_9HYPH|nr:ABC transporter permease [Segnochrobactrum spirostomi]MQT11945.1 ABC transporter permease [Segnochrobactrum spirostomi]
MNDVLWTVLTALDSTIRLSTPLILAGLAGLYSERSGVFDIGLDGKMLVGAFAAGCIAASTGSPWIALVAAIAASTLFALIHGFVSITNRGNQIVSGVAINFLALGLTTLLGQNWYGEGGRTPSLSPPERFMPVVLPFADQMKDVPFIGPIYYELVSGQSILTYLAFACVPLTWWVLFRTRFGLRLRAVGENPAAVDTAGISVAFLRYRAVMCTGILCGIAGAYLSVSQSAGFLKAMTAGKGYIALAALIFANWKPGNVMWACLLFGFLDALSIRLQGTPVPGIGVVPVQVFQALPYILTCVLLAGFLRRSTPPKAGGVPYTKERT